MARGKLDTNTLVKVILLLVLLWLGLEVLDAALGIIFGPLAGIIGVVIIILIILWFLDYI